MRGILLAALCCLSLSASISAGQAAGKEELDLQAQLLARRFVETLKPQLRSALESGGPAEAIEVCSVTAPAIAQQLSADSGWRVRRVSLRPRNSASAQPDDWERIQLQRFDQSVSRGEAPQAYSEQVDGYYRMLQPQRVQALCLACHGERLAPEVRTALESYYPGDTATGYRAGQVRGAISLTFPPD